MSEIHEILKKYWGFDTFRPLQEDIINSIIEKKDTLALLPTGGGKSICFQVPALLQEGICIVVTPLIALMKDQIEILLSKGINAVAIFSGMSKTEIDVTLDNCRFGSVKFLYLSPERLKTEIVIERVKKMKVNMLVVDEAHCISQWGYDFRPAYLEIGLFRKYLSNVPLLALTATATKGVVLDIQQKLFFATNNIFTKSFERKNLIYYSIEEENKLQRVIQICNKIKGTGLIYVRNRKRTQEIATFLNQQKISADYYHGGLEQTDRERKQTSWKNNNTRIIVCTNAFGMGIDKPDVRFVIHLDLPDSIEAYFQEAGRGGRDGKTAHAILLYDGGDKLLAQENWTLSFPEMAQIRLIYQSIANYLQLAIGSGFDAVFDFKIEEFIGLYKLSPILVFSCLQILEKEGLIIFNKERVLPTRFKILVSNIEFYNFGLKAKKYEELLKTILRTYNGAFESYIKLNEYDLARQTKRNVDGILTDLNLLHKLKIIEFLPRAKSTQLIFAQPRQDAQLLNFPKNSYQWRKEQSKKRLDSLIKYVYNNSVCRSKQLLNYFNETTSTDCGYCDVCIEKKKKELTELEYVSITNEIKSYIKLQPHTVEFLTQNIVGFGAEKIIHAIQLLLDDDVIIYDNNLCLTLN